MYPASRSHITDHEYRMWLAAKQKEDWDLDTWLDPNELRLVARLELHKPTPDWTKDEIRTHIAASRYITDKLAEIVRKGKAFLKKGTL
jgi:hypothetical protein